MERRGRGERRGPVIAALLAIGLLAALMSSSAIASNVVPGFYSGSHVSGGAFNLQTTPDGSGVTNITTSDVPGSSCTFMFPSDNYVPAAPIIGDHFDDLFSGDEGFDAYGDFQPDGFVHGFFHVHNDMTGCDSGQVEFLAHNPAAPSAGSGGAPDDEPKKKKKDKTCRKPGAESAKKHHKKKGCGKKHHHKKKQRA
jgi:hypothetical protein